MPTPEERSRRQRMRVLKRWGNTPDRTAATAPARQALADSWLRKVREEYPDIDDATAAKMAENRRQLFYLALQEKSIAARKARKAAGTSGDGDEAA